MRYDVSIGDMMGIMSLILVLILVLVFVFVFVFTLRLGLRGLVRERERIVHSHFQVCRRREHVRGGLEECVKA